MREFAIAGLVVALFAGVGAVEAQDMPEMPTPQKEHEWLRQLEGEWTVEMECKMGPDAPPQKGSGEERVRTVGGFWTVADGKGTFGGMAMTSVLTLGYDPQKQKYVGTWIDSVSNHMWSYEGEVDAEGKVLTLETEGPCPLTPGKPCKFKETIEIKSANHKVFTSSVQGEDGEWVTFVTANYRRKQ
jgi:hypothetical protein